MENFIHNFFILLVTTSFCLGNYVNNIATFSPINSYTLKLAFLARCQKTSEQFGRHLAGSSQGMDE